MEASPRSTTPRRSRRGSRGRLPDRAVRQVPKRRYPDERSARVGSLVRDLRQPVPTTTTTRRRTGAACPSVTTRTTTAPRSLPARPSPSSNGRRLTSRCSSSGPCTIRRRRPPGTDRALAHLPRWRPRSYDEANVSDKPAWVRNRGRLDAQRARRLDAFRLDQYRSLIAVDRAEGILALDFFTTETLWLRTIHVLFTIELRSRRVHVAVSHGTRTQRGLPSKLGTWRWAAGWKGSDS
jgi:hypothetical protein